MTAARRQTRTEAVVEDCEWMARWGESLTGAARRLGYRDRKVLERTLWRAGRPDLTAVLKAAETDDLRAVHNAARRGRRARGLAA